MPTFDLYRETTTREHYRIEATTADAALLVFREGDAHLSNDEVIDAQPVTIALNGTLILDEADMPAEAEAEPERETFTCKVGISARAYFDVELEGINADEVLDKLRDLARSGFLDANVSDTHTEIGEDDPVVLYVRDESGNDSCELVPLDYQPFDIPPPVVGIHPYDAKDIGTQFRLLRSMIGTTDPLGFADMKEILAHIEATLSPRTYVENVVHR